MNSLSSTTQYQRLTEYIRGRQLGRKLDWSNQPSSRKNYPQAKVIPLPRELSLPRIEAARALQRQFQRPAEQPALSSLAQLLYMAYGFTATVDHGPQTYYYRSAPSAGALYPIDIYLAARGIDGLADGLYYYHLENFALQLINPAPPPPFLEAPSIILSSLFFRTAWKYGDRAFRYCLLDCGHILENIALISPVLGFEAEVKLDFNDRELNEYLGFDPDKERVLGLIKLGSSGTDLQPHSEVSPLKTLPPDPAAPHEPVYEQIGAIGRLTSAPLIPNPAPTASLWPDGAGAPLPFTDQENFTGPTLVQSLQSRRSRRNFRPLVLEKGQLSRALGLISVADFSPFLNFSLVISSFKDISDGYYYYQPQRHSLVKIRGGFISPSVSLAALGQEWVGRANLILVLSAPLQKLEDAWGPRSLRLAYLAAGRTGQRAYLAAETIGWGACGVGAFFDPEIRDILTFPPGEEILYLLPVGPVKMRTHGGRPSEG